MKKYFDDGSKSSFFQPDWEEMEALLPDIPEIAEHSKKVALLEGNLSTARSELEKVNTRIAEIEQHRVSNALDEYPSDALAVELKELKTVVSRREELKATIAALDKALAIKRGERFDHLLLAKGNEVLLTLCSSLPSHRDSVIAKTNDLLNAIRGLVAEYRKIVSVYSQMNGKGVFAAHGAIGHIESIERDYKNTREDPLYFTGEIENLLSIADFVIDGVHKRGFFGSGKYEPRPEKPAPSPQAEEPRKPYTKIEVPYSRVTLEDARRART